MVEGDITELPVDAVVNAANRRMRGGGGVDGAIHAAAGPDLMDECVERFPNGLRTGEAGWTHGHLLPARWVIHVVGPNYSAGETRPHPAGLLLRRARCGWPTSSRRGRSHSRSCRPASTAGLAATRSSPRSTRSGRRRPPCSQATLVAFGRAVYDEISDYLNNAG